MKVQTKTVLLDRQGVDEASAVIEDWLEAAEIPHRDVLRIRLTAEELLAAICGHGGEDLHAELRFGRWLGDWRLQIRYDGERFDPTAPRENEMHEWLAELLSRTGFMPTWRARGRENELQLHIPQEGLGVGVTLALFLDFLCTSARIPILHLEMLLQAERLGLLDKEVLRSKAP